MYIDRLDDIFHKYSNKYHLTIKMKPIDDKTSTYIDFDVENIVEDPKFEVDDQVTISKCKNIFAKDCIPNWSEESFVTKNVKSTEPWTYFIINLNDEEIIETFFEKEFQKANSTEFGVGKIIKKRGDKAGIISLTLGLIKKI